MSFDFGNVNQFKAQAAYKDGGGMGGGGMYFKQGKNQKKDQQDKDVFEFSSDKKDENEINFDSELEEKDIPKDTLYNKFVNWFRPQD